jgi:hypothetical protein
VKEWLQWTDEHIEADSMRSSDNFSDAWRKSSFSGYNTNCVEVGHSGDTIGVRDTQNRQGGSLVFSTAQWTAFISGVRGGEFDRKRGAR